MKLHGIGGGKSPAALGLVCAFLLQGCITPLVRDQAQVDPIVASDVGTGNWKQPEPIVPDCTVQQWIDRATRPETSDDPKRRCVGGVSRRGAPPPSRQYIKLPAINATGKDLRTQAQAELMTYADLICDQHLAGIYGTNSALNFTGGLATTLLSGAAAIASGRSATNLAAGSALFSGTRSLMNSEIYYGYIGPAVITELRALRTDLRTQIGSKRSCALAAYPAQEAINDALVYHDACSFATGLASLLNKAGVTRVSEDKLRTGQIAVLNQQLVDRRAEYAAVQIELLKTPTNATLLKKADRLREEISNSEAVQRFAGVVDPNAGQAVPPAPRNDAERLAIQISAIEADTKNAVKNAARLAVLIKLREEILANSADIAAYRIQISETQRSIDARRNRLATLPPGQSVLEKEIADLVIVLGGLTGKLVAAGGLIDTRGDALTSTGQDCTRPVAQSGTGR